ncbi:MAG: hypothetical protein H7A49_08475 [Akkermansiaceae bacterium]|nr:hypothetical protein [Akkermansiaceae bacterium]MCP5543927.1 hypothetical protein [Akkermansiaceae bacterium]MCP5547559.1 hypothetical protein [Akkermansiaceae bacterium]
MKSTTRFLLGLSAAASLSALPSRGAEPPSAFTRTYTRSGGDVHVDFILTSVRGPAFEVYLHEGGSAYQPFTTDRPARTYLGTVQEFPGAVAAGQLLGDGTVRTAILFEDGTTWRGTGTSLTIPSPASWTPKYPTSLIGEGGAGSDVHAAEIGLDLTYTYFNQAGQDPAEALERAEWSLIETNAAYLRDAAIFERLGRVIIRTESTDDRSTSLSDFKNEWNNVMPADLPGSNHDLAATVVVTGSSGLAYVGSVGTSNRYSWNSIRGSSTDGSFCTVWRHEGGHNWGAGHSEGGAPEGPTIMSGNGLSRFSSSDLAVMVAHRNSRAPGLLDHLGAWPTPLPPRANADRGKALANGSPLTLDVLANDSDTNSDAVSIHSFETTSERGGTITLLSASGPGEDDRLSYVADPAFTDGIDWFTYRIEDATGRQAVAHVMLLPPPQQPDFDVVADVVSLADGEWTAAAVWDNEEAAGAGHNYQIRSGNTVDAPVSGSVTFPGDSIRVSGTLRLRHTSAGGNTTQSLDLKPLVLDDGAMLQSYNTSLGNVSRMLNSAVAVPSGGATIRIQSDSGGAYSNTLSLNGGLFGSGNVHLTGSLQGVSGERRKLSLDSPESLFSGNWTVDGDGGDNSRRLFLIANAARSLGTGNVTLGTRAQLRNAVPHGIDSVASVELTTATSTLELVEPWLNPGAGLVVAAGTLDLGAGHSRVGDLQVGGFSLAVGTYGAADLTNLGSGATILGSGTLSVGPFPPDAISVSSGSSADAATWSHALAAPVAGTQGEGLSYLIQDFTVTSNDPSSNQQAFVGRSLRIGDAGVLDLARTHNATNQNVSYDLPPLEMEDGGTVRFRASVGSATHSITCPLVVSGETSIRLNGGSYSNNASLAGGISGSGTIAVVSDSNAGSSSGNVRRLTISSADNPFVGTWTVDHSASGDDFCALASSAAGSLGTGSVVVGTRSRLVNDHEQGIDSLVSVRLATSTSLLALTHPWNNPDAALVVQAGSLDLGTGHSVVGTMEHAGALVPAGTYDSADLAAIGIAATGGGFLTVSEPLTGGVSAYADWIASFPAIGDPEERGYLADPDHDKYPNLIEYLLDSDPSSSSGIPAIEWLETSGGILFRFTRVKDATITSVVETSADPAGEWSDAAPAWISETDHGGSVTVSVTIPLPLDPARLFARLRVMAN